MFEKTKQLCAMALAVTVISAVLVSLLTMIQTEAGAAPDQTGAPSACTLPPEAGPCSAFIPRWYHDPDTGECKQFIYGGCGGNANNYATHEACERACGGTTPTCHLPPDSGPCNAVIPRWYYNPLIGECQEFTYGGCFGNANNFESQVECQHACANIEACQLPPETGPCLAVILRWYHDPDTGECKQFIYGGCGGNANNYATHEACERACGGTTPTCHLPPDSGPCLAAIPRWYFDPIIGECLEFTYGGCLGNANNFQSQIECQHACANIETCSGDLNGDGVVNVFDLLALLEDWGSCPGCPADLNDDDVVNVFDLVLLLENWGPCPSEE